MDDSAARRDRRERTRTALLDAAARVWAERGIPGASLNEISAAAGLTKGAVYSNFTGKADLLLALLERHTLRGPHDGPDRLLDGLCRRLSAQGGGDATADAAADATADATVDVDGGGESGRARPLILLLVEFWLYGMRDYSAGWRVADWFHAARTRLAGELTESGALPEAAAYERAAMMIAMDLGLALQHLLDPDRVPATLCATALDDVAPSAPCSSSP